MSHYFRPNFAMKKLFPGPLWTGWNGIAKYFVFAKIFTTNLCPCSRWLRCMVRCSRSCWLCRLGVGVVVDYSDTVSALSLTTRKHVGLVVDYANFELCNRICLRKRNISPDCFRLLIRGPQMTFPSSFLSYLFTFIQTLEVWESSYFLGISVRPFTRLLFCTLMNAGIAETFIHTIDADNVFLTL